MFYFVVKAKKEQLRQFKDFLLASNYSLLISKV